MDGIRYLFGLRGQSGFGSSSTATEVCRAMTEQRIRGKTIVLTGWTTGIGLECVRVLSRYPVTLVLLGRGSRDLHEDRLRQIHRENAAAGEGAEPLANIDLVSCNLADMKSVATAAQSVIARHPAVHVLINNGGVACTPPTITADGMELQFATNVASHFALTQRLLPLLIAAGTSEEPSRVVNVASKAHHLIKGKELDTRPFTSVAVYPLFGGMSYALSKLCNILHVRALQKRLDEAGIDSVTAYSCHPGGVSTSVWRHVMPGWVQRVLLDVASRPFLKTIPQGAATQLFLAFAPHGQLCKAGYYQDCNVASMSPLAADDCAAETLWTTLTQLTGDQGLKGSLGETAQPSTQA